MSKFISYKPGIVLDGEGVETPVTIFESDLGELSAVAQGSPIEKILIDEVVANGGVEASTLASQVEPTPVIEAPIAPVVEPLPELVVPLPPIEPEVV